MVYTHSPNNAWALLSLVSSSVWPLVNPVSVVAFLLPWSPHWLSSGLIMVTWHLATIYWCSGACRFTSPLPSPPFLPWNALFNPQNILYRIFFWLYRNVHKVDWYIFDRGEKYWASGGGVGTTMPPYPSYTSCTLNVDTPLWSCWLFPVLSVRPTICAESSVVL